MRRDEGFSLLEVLVATALTLTVVGLTTQAYLGALNANEAINLMADTNQNLQSGTSFLSDDLMKAGQNSPIGGIIAPSGAGSVPIVAPGPGARPLGGEGRLPAVVLGNAAGPLVSDDDDDGARTDVITVAYVDDGYPALTFTAMAADASSGTVLYDVGDPADPADDEGTRIDAGRFRVQPGDLFMLQQNGSIVHEVTQAPGGAAPQLITFGAGGVTGFNQPAASSGGLGTFTGGGAPTAANVVARRLKVVTYFIDKTNVGRPRLMRQENGRPPAPIALDVENLQITYDFFVQGSPFRNEAALTGALKVTDIRKINVYLAARSDVKLRQQKRYVRNSVLTQVTVRSLGLTDQYR